MRLVKHRHHKHLSRSWAGTLWYLGLCDYMCPLAAVMHACIHMVSANAESQCYIAASLS
jgi:hypothetical protein